MITETGKKSVLLKRAEKLIVKSIIYPTMPQGDLSPLFLENVFTYNPLYVLDAVKANARFAFKGTAGAKISADMADAAFNAAWQNKEKELKSLILATLISNARNDFSNLIFSSDTVADLRYAETVIIYYSFGIFKIAKELNNMPGVLFAKAYLKSFNSLRFKGKRIIITKDFERDKAVYETLMKIIEDKKEKETAL